MNNSNQCPECKTYILGTYCANCRKDISEMYDLNSMLNNPVMGDWFKNIMRKGGSDEQNIYDLLF